VTRKQIILDLLIKARLRDNDVNQGWLLHDDLDPAKQVWISGGFRPIYYFRGPDRGGDAADVRLREWRREHLVPIELRWHKWKLPVYSKGIEIPKTTPIYRIDLSQSDILTYDWTPAWEEPFNWIFQPTNGQPVFDPVILHETKEGQLTFV